MASKPPSKLKERGRALWKELDVDANTAEGVLADEACRIADRLDLLFDLLDEDGNLTADEAILRNAQYRLDDLFTTDDERNIFVTIKVTGLQNELRQNQALLRQMITSVIGVKNFEPTSKVRGKEPADADVSRGVPDPKTSSVVDEFTKRRSERTGA